MTTDAAANMRFAILCVEDEPEVLEALARDIRSATGDAFEVEVCSDAAEARARLTALAEQHVRVPLVIADHILAEQTGVDLLIELHEDPLYRASRKILLSGQAALDEVTRVLNRGALNRHIGKPWLASELAECVRDLLAEYLLEHAPEEVERFISVIGVGRLSQAYRSNQRTLQTLDTQLRRVRRSFLANENLSDDAVVDEMIASIDHALGTPPREHLPAGATLLEEGQTVDSIFIVTSGDVHLTRTMAGEELGFHLQSAGRIIGLLALARGRRAFFTCRAVTEVTGIRVRVDDLDRALQQDATLSVSFVTALVRNLAARSRRIAELRAEVTGLNTTLCVERDQMAGALGRLKATQMRLVESEKLATLGQLSAGVAHELNNPVAAMQRAVEFIAEDIVAVLSTHPDGGALKSATLAALGSAPLSTREARAQQTTLANELGDAALARRLIKVGIATADAYRQRFGNRPDDQSERLLSMMERYHQLGASLRNVSRCADHIAGIVKSLRSYVRSDQAAVSDVNVHEGLDDTLRMFGHALRNVGVTCEYGDLPPIECHVGEINQVWTNLIANALHAMDGAGSLQVETVAPDAEHVRVRIVDSGPGIAAELRERIFEPNFTTKDGQAQFGLGLGLPICRQIVARHGGDITVESQPGRTAFTVTLPVQYQRIPGEGLSI